LRNSPKEASFKFMVDYIVDFIIKFHFCNQTI